MLGLKFTSKWSLQRRFSFHTSSSQTALPVSNSEPWVLSCRFACVPLGGLHAGARPVFGGLPKSASKRTPILNPEFSLTDSPARTWAGFTPDSVLGGLPESGSNKRSLWQAGGSNDAGRRSCGTPANSPATASLTASPGGGSPQGGSPQGGGGIGGKDSGFWSAVDQPAPQPPALHRFAAMRFQSGSTQVGIVWTSLKKFQNVTILILQCNPKLPGAGTALLPAWRSLHTGFRWFNDRQVDFVFFSTIGIALCSQTACFGMHTTEDLHLE